MNSTLHPIKLRMQLFIIIFSYLVLTVPLMNKAFWHDEIYSTSLYLNPLPVIQPISPYSNWSTDWQRQIQIHPPAAYFLYYVWIRCFGDSEISLHVPVVIAGLGALILLYFLGNLVFNNDVSFMAALGLTFSSSYIMYSVSACYAIFELLIFVASILCLSRLITTKSAGLFRWLLILNLFGVFIYYFYFLYFFVQTMVLWYLRKDLKIRSGYFMINLLLFVLFIGVIALNFNMQQYSHSRHRHWPKNDLRTTFYNIIYLPSEYTK